MVPTIQVTAPGDTSELSERVASWCKRISGYLGKPPPEGARVHVHEAQGIAQVRGSTVHLFRTPEGEPDTSFLPHELVHLVAGPSRSRFLSEGLAVDAAATLRLGEPCWPCYRLSPDEWTIELRRRSLVEPLPALVECAQSIRLNHPENTTRSLSAAWRLYIVAGSFTGYLFRNLHRNHFWEGYSSGLLWLNTTQLHELEQRWLSQLPPRLTPKVRALLSSSLDDAAAELRRRSCR